MSVSIRPLENRVAIKQTETETVIASGLVIPDIAKEEPQEGTVMAAGPGCVGDKGVRMLMDVEEGDKVTYTKYGGAEVKYQGEEHITLSARDLLAVMEQSARDLSCMGGRAYARPSMFLFPLHEAPPGHL